MGKGGGEGVSSAEVLDQGALVEDIGSQSKSTADSLHEQPFGHNLQLDKCWKPRR